MAVPQRKPLGKRYDIFGGMLLPYLLVNKDSISFFDFEDNLFLLLSPNYSIIKYITIDMKLKHYLAINLAAMIISWLLWLWILFRVDPFAANWLGRSLFYLTMFAAVFSSLSLFGFISRFSLIRQKLAHRAVVAAFRQSALIAFGVVITLWLLSRQLFNWFNLIILAGGLAMLEFFILSCQPIEKTPINQSLPEPTTSEEIISSTFNERNN